MWVASGGAMATWLKAGLETSPYHQLARKYLPKGPGALFTFGLKCGFEAGVRVVESVDIAAAMPPEASPNRCPTP